MARIRVTFWSLVVVTILAFGVFARVLDAAPSAGTRATVAVTAATATVAGGLAVRIAVVVARWRAAP